MAFPLPGLLESLRSRRAMRRWHQAAEDGETADAVTLARLAAQAREIGQHARALTEVADRRLAGTEASAGSIERPPQCDWAWRPAPWAQPLHPASVAGAVGGTKLEAGVTLFHDCPLAEISLHQIRARDRGAHAPYVLSVDALGFQGSFLSLAMDLPKDAVQSLRRSHILGVSTYFVSERPMEMFARLNIRQGPNTEQLVSELRPGDRPDSPVVAEFDLGFHDINPAKLENAWIDLIFERPEMSLVRIHDLTLTRRPRADI